MFTIIEISRTEALDIYHAPYKYPFNVAAKYNYGPANEEIADFWKITFGVTEPLTPVTDITGVVYENNINYSPKTSEGDTFLDDRSFYWNLNEQRLQIHLDHLVSIDLVEPNFSEGIAIGLSRDKVRYLSGREFLPLIKSFPPVSYDIDKLNYAQLNFALGTLVLSNTGGFFNEFKDTPIYGNLVTIKTGEEGDDFEDLVLRRAYYIEDYDFGFNEFIVEIQDTRKSLSTQIPFRFFNSTDYPNIGDLSLGKPIPFGYGPLHHAPGFCINENAVSASVDPVFIFTEIITAPDITVWVLDDDVWVEQTSGVTPNFTTGEVTVSGAKKLSGSTYGVLKVRADVDGVPNTYASDVIVDINDRYLGITFDSSNYDTVQWAAEETFLAPIGFYIDKVQDVFDYIREIQNASSVGFKYDTIKGRRTIIVDNPNKTKVGTIPPVDIFNITDVVADSNKDDVYNKIAIGYDRSIDENSAPRAENDEFFDVSFANYKITRVFDLVSGLTDQTEAENRAALAAEDFHLIRRVFNLQVHGEEYLDLQLLDILEAQIDLERFEFEYTDQIQGVLTGPKTIQGVLTGENILQGQLTPVSAIDNGVELFGLIRGQVVSAQPDYDLKLTNIQLRERPLSDVWEEIYGS